MLENILPDVILRPLNLIKFDDLCEVRLRLGRPTTINYKNTYYFLGYAGLCNENEAIVCTKEIMQNVISKASNYSVYAVNEEIKELEDVRKVIDIAIKHLKLDNLEFNIIIVDNEYIHTLNREYRGIDRPTDVISFALEDNKDFVEVDHRVLGDIYISLDKAKSQAEEYGHSFKREICFLACHGLLHLLGYDHMKPEDEKVMFGLQEEILNEANITK